MPDASFFRLRPTQNHVTGDPPSFTLVGVMLIEDKLSLGNRIDEQLSQ